MRTVMDEECCANCEYWVEIYQKCDHPEQLACKADDYAAMPEDVCELYEERKALKNERNKRTLAWKNQR